VTAGILAVVVADLTSTAPVLVRLPLAAAAGVAPVAAAGLLDPARRAQVLGLLRAPV
jgi:hypothetical protein